MGNPVPEPLEQGPFDACSWQGWLDRQRAQFADIAPGSGIGLVRTADFSAGAGPMLIWRRAEQGMEAVNAAFGGFDPAQADVLLVMDAQAESALQEEGIEGARRLLAQGHLQIYLLSGGDTLDESGLGEFVDSLGLMFPRH